MSSGDGAEGLKFSKGSLPDSVLNDEMMNVPHIGGPLDGQWAPVNVALDYNGEYRRNFLRWMSDFYPAMIHSSVKDEEILKLLIVGFRGGYETMRMQEYRARNEPRPTRRKFDLD